MAFFFDICDFTNTNIIGENTVEVDCLTWEDMQQTSLQTSNVYFKNFNDYISTTIPCIMDTPCESIIQEKVFIDFYQETYIDFLSKSEVFWNMFVCSPLTGTENMSTNVPIIDGDTELINYVNDYGDGTFNTSIVNDYQDSLVKLMCDIKNIMVLLMDETFEQSTFTEFYPIGGV